MTSLRSFASLTTALVAGMVACPVVAHAADYWEPWQLSHDIGDLASITWWRATSTCGGTADCWKLSTKGPGSLALPTGVDLVAVTTYQAAATAGQALKWTTSIVNNVMGATVRTKSFSMPAMASWQNY